MTTAQGRVAYTDDLAAWKALYPEGSVMRDALLSHEQVHARRQLAYGLEAWIERCRREPEFRWSEEQEGWRVQITKLNRAEAPIVPDEIAATLSGPIYGHM